MNSNSGTSSLSLIIGLPGVTGLPRLLCLLLIPVPCFLSARITHASRLASPSANITQAVNTQSANALCGPAKVRIPTARARLSPGEVSLRDGAGRAAVNSQIACHEKQLFHFFYLLSNYF
jgi:hypothetical protein